MPRQFVSTRAELLARGISDRTLAEAVAAGSLIRLRRGWYTVPGAPHELQIAVKTGARLGCVSALDWHGVWTLPHRHHLSVPRTMHRRPSPHVLHWRAAPALDSRTLVESPLDAFELFATCGDDREVVVVADSAVQRRILSSADVEHTLERTARGRRLLTRLDPNAESGTETLLRLALRARGIALRSQVTIAGIGRVDFVIGDRLVIEVDGREWHDTESAFEKDRRRDAQLVARGYVVMRFSYRRVIDDLDAAMDEVSALIHRREHRWRARHGNRSG